VAKCHQNLIISYITFIMHIYSFIKVARHIVTT